MEFDKSLHVTNAILSWSLNDASVTATAASAAAANNRYLLWQFVTATFFFFSVFFTLAWKNQENFFSGTILLWPKATVSPDRQ